MSQRADAAPVASPCTSICIVDPVTGLCSGCFRTLEEIAGWIDFSATEKRSVIAALEARQSAFGAAIEARLVLPTGFKSTDSLRYVLGITVDGHAEDWYSLIATLDTTARLGTAPLSDRDRVKLDLGPGPHRIEVELTAGESDQLLVRIREPANRED